MIDTNAQADFEATKKALLQQIETAMANAYRIRFNAKAGYCELPSKDGMHPNFELDGTQTISIFIDTNRP